VIRSDDVDDEFMKLLNLGRELLQSVLPFILAKVNRVSFGLLTAEEVLRAKTLDPTMPRSRCMQLFQSSRNFLTI
jgi:hypothetical protein